MPVLFVLLLLAVVGCTGGEEEPPKSGPYPRIVVPRPDVRVEQTLQRAEPPVAEPPATGPKSDLLRGETLIDLINTNLDLDKTDEQILVLMAAGRPQLRIAVVDHDEIRDRWSRVAQYNTLAANPNAFQVQTEDIIGDHSLEILVEGLDETGASTLDVLRRTSSPTGSGLFYSPILRVSADRSIAVRRQNRPQSYHFAQKHDQAFPIVLERTDPDRPDSYDVVRETYQWVYDSRRYVKQLQERIRPEELVQQQLQQLFSSRSAQADYERFLEGPWYKKNDIKTMVVFVPTEGLIAFYDGEVQELYRITYSSIRGYRLTVQAHNTSLHKSDRKKSIMIVIQNNDVLTVNIKSGDWRFPGPFPWEGEFHRLTEDLQKSVLASSTATPGPSPVRLSGIFREGDGLEIAFEAPHFTWLAGDTTQSGGFAVTAGVPILNAHYLDREGDKPTDLLSFKFISEASLTTRDESYLMEYAEETKGTVMIRTLTLTPAALTIQGAVALSKDSIILEQVETVEATPEGTPSQTDGG